MRRHVEANVWHSMFERWHDAAECEPLPIMWPRLPRWWPWHPAVIAGAAAVLLLTALWVGP